LGNRAIALNKTFNAAATFEVASGIASIGTIRILGTEVYADTGEGVAVRVPLGSARGTVLRYGASLSARVFTAIAAETIEIAVKRSSGSQAVSISSAINTGSSGNVTLRLVGLETTIVYAVRVLGASLARLVSHAVVSGTVLLATVVIGRSACAGALVRRNTGTSVTDKISSHGRRSVVGNAVSIGGARVAATILVTVVVGTANSVGGASSVTDLVNADGLTTKITTADSRRSAISVGETIEANSIGLTVGTLSTSTSLIVNGGARASVNAKSGGLIAVRLRLDFSTIQAGASGRGTVNDTVLARARGLAVVTALSLAAGVVRTHERAHANARSIARSLSSHTRSTRKTSLRAINISTIGRVGDDSGRAGGLAVSTDTVGTAVSSVVGGDTSLGNPLG